MKPNTKIAIKVPVPKWKQKEEWGDYHMATALKREFVKKGFDVIIQTLFEWYNEEDNDCDVVIVLRGLNQYKPNPKHFNIIWNISHPDMVETDEYNSYDHVFIASKQWAKKISEEVDVPVDCLLQCTDTDLFYHEYDDKYNQDILFVGNSRKIFRTIIKDLLPTDKDLAVYGNDWDLFIDRKYIKDKHIANNELRKAYSSCKILLNDHWDDMKKKGFVSNRIFDGLASGAFIISDKFTDDEIFSEAIETYENAEDLDNLIEYYLENSSERTKKALIGQKIVRKYHTFGNRVEKMIKVIESELDTIIPHKTYELNPEYFMNKVWDKVISPALMSAKPKRIVEFGYNKLLTGHITSYSKQNNVKLDIISKKDHIQINHLIFDNPGIISLSTDFNVFNLDFGMIFIDACNCIKDISSNIDALENKIACGNNQVMFLHSLNCIENNSFENKQALNTMELLESSIKKYNGKLSYFKTNAFNGMIAVVSDDLKESFEKIFSQNFLEEIEEERRLLSIEYKKSKEMEIALENVIIEKKIDLEVMEEEFNENKRTLDKLSHDLKNQRAIVTKLKDKNQEISKTLSEYDAKYEDLQRNFDSVSNELVKIDYLSGKYRPIKQRILSKIPSIYILSRMNETGYKNALINIKGYRKIKKEGLLDVGFYIRKYNDIKISGQDPILHYLYKGFDEGRQPNPNFDCEHYFSKRGDVQRSGINPLVHYSLYRTKDKKNGTSPSTTAVIPKEGSIKSFRNNLSRSGVKGALHRSEETLLQGWLAKIGDNNPRTAILNIDGQSFEIESSMLRPDLKKNGINEGKHAFEFIVPMEYINNTKHHVKLIDKETMATVAEQEFSWTQNRTYTDFTGFLSHSLVSPLIRAPFGEEDKRCFAVMENIAKNLVKKSENVFKLVSIIMPVYNRVDTVQAAIESVLKQSYQNFELIIVDDGSEDGSNELIRNISDERIILKTNEKCSGVSRARNIGLESAKGEYIMYLDSDNTWDPEYVAAMVGAFTELEDADAIYSGQLLFKGNNVEPFAVRYGSYNKSLLYNRSYIDMNAFCHKKHVYDSIGGFHEELRRYVDYDWIMNISSTFQMYSIPVLLSNYYYDKADNTITNDIKYVDHLDTVRERQKHRMLNHVFKGSLKKGVSIVIPSYESIEDIKECLNTIYSLNKEDMIETVVVDNNSSEDVVEYLNGQAKLGKIRFIENKTNYGFTYAVNQGIEISKKDNDILILNNDAFLTPGSVEALQEAAYNLEDAGIVVPQQVLPGGTKTISKHVPFAYPDRKCDVNISAHHKNIAQLPIYHDGKITELKFAPFFCVYIKRDILNASVGLDAEFGRHYRSDRIFCDYVRNVMMLKIYHVADAVVYHELQKATDQIRLDSDKKEEFDLMYIKNQWEPDLADQLGFKKAKWDT
jgi:glycosyltransferase involved in cell wall biosynthesis